jgi:porphyrinogen peroxidase
VHIRHGIKIALTNSIFPAAYLTLLAKQQIMPTAQPFLNQGARDEVHLQFKFKDVLDERKFLKSLGKIWEARVMGIEDVTLNRNHESATGGANIIVGFRPEFWRRVAPQNTPDNLYSFTEDLAGINGMVAPAAQLDLWVWITHINSATIYDGMHAIIEIVQPYADLVSEQYCFPYHNNVTFDGFGDGVANPNPFRAGSVAIIADGQKGAGGSTCLLQKWHMDIDKLRALKVSEAEKVYGRTKAGSHELSPLPGSSHVARNQFTRNGQEIDIVRRNANYGSATEQGIMFVGFCSDITVTMGMLQQMYGVGPDGLKITDRLLDFSKALSSAIYFVPSIEALQSAGIHPRDEA